MKDKYPKYLPIGSVVMLTGGKKRLMITGFAVSAKETTTKVYDYCGILYPEGMLTSDQTAVFNHDQIDKIYALGYSDDEEKEFKKKFAELLKKQNIG